MKKRLLSAILLTVLVVSLTSGVVLGYLYKAPISITENSSTSYDMLPIVTPMNNSWLASNGFMSSSANDTRVQTLGGFNKPHMVADNKTLTAIPVPASSQTNLYFVTGESEASAMDIITGHDGYITIADDADLELGNEFEIEFENTWVDTDAGTGGRLLSKTGAIKTYISDTEEITCGIGAKNVALDFTRGNSDWVRVPDDPALSFTDGAGNDKPFSISCWVKLDDASAGTFASKYISAGNLKEWAFRTDGTDKIFFTVTNTDGTKSITRISNAITAHEGSWTHVAGTYDGGEVIGGLHTYVNGVLDESDTSVVGVYAGMTDTTSLVAIGAYEGGTSNYLDGVTSNLKIFDKELSATEVLQDYSGGGYDSDYVAWWSLTDNAGNPVDNSGNGHDANQNLADWVADYPPLATWVPQLEVTATGVTSGEHKVETWADTVNLYISIDDAVAGAGYDEVALGGATVPDNANTWYINQNNVVPYIGHYKHTTAVGGYSLKAWYAPNDIIAGTTLPDRAGGDNPGTFSWGSNPSNVGASLGSMYRGYQWHCYGRCSAFRGSVRLVWRRHCD